MGAETAGAEDEARAEEEAIGADDAEGAELAGVFTEAGTLLTGDVASTLGPPVQGP